MNTRKTFVCLTALLGIANVTIAQEQPDDKTLKIAIGNMIEEGFRDDLRDVPDFYTAQDIADKHKASPEQMTRVLEEFVRKELTEWEKAEGGDKSERGGWIVSLVDQFNHFHGPDTPALVKECVLTLGSRFIVETYITILGGGGDSVALLREMIANGQFDGVDRHLLYRHLGKFIEQLKGKGQTADVEKICAFMKEMIQAEQHLGSLQQLDNILCAHLEGYASDPLRQPVLKRIGVMAEEARKQMEIRDKELEEFNEGLRRQSEEWKAKHLPPKPAQPPEATAATATVENILPPADTVETPSSNVPATTTQPPPEPAETKSVPWKLPLLIGIIVIGGAIAAWRRLKGKP